MRAAGATARPSSTTGRTTEAEIRGRVAALERLLADPADAASPFGYEASFTADELGAPAAALEEALKRFGLGAEFVPVVLGGRLERTDALVRVLRAVFRREAAVGVGHTGTSLAAAVPVWAAGSTEQRRRTAELLLGGSRIALAPHELAYGNDYLCGEFDAAPYRGGFLLDGAKPAVLNAARADALVVFGRTSPAPGARSHSAFLVDTAELPADRHSSPPPGPSGGPHGHGTRGLVFDECPVPADTLIGEVGHGVELALRGFQFTRAVTPGAVLGGADTALRTAVGHALDHPPYGGPPLDHPHHRSLLTASFVTLLTCDSLALAAGRALHLLPEQSGVPAAVAEYLVPRLLEEMVYDLSAVLGARFHARDGAYGALRRYLRDLPLAGLCHAGAAACQVTLAPQLPRLARRSWQRAEAPPDALFTTCEEELPPLDPARLSPFATADPLASSLVAVSALLDAEGGPADGRQTELSLLRELVRGLVAELGRLGEKCCALPADGSGALATPQRYALVDRHALVLAGAASVGVWHVHRGTGSFLGDPAWLVEALMVLSQRLGLPLPRREVPTAERVLRELLDRYHSDRSYDLYACGLYGT